MGLMDKLPFGKKKEEFPAFSQDPSFPTFNSPQDPLAVQPSSGIGQPSAYPSQYPSYPSQSPMYGQQAPSYGNSSNDLEVLKAKMDAIQATLDSLNQRFAAIERFINDNSRRRW